MSQEQPEKLTSGIQISKVIAGTLAAVAAATLGSFLGVAGTLAGAALASVIGSVGTEIFNNSLKRGTRTLQTVAPTFIRAPAAVGTPPVAAATEEENPAHTVAQPARGFNWKPAVIGAFAVFVLAMGGISVAEAAMDKPLATAVTGKQTSGTTTFSSLGGSSSSSSEEEKKPTPAESTDPSEAPDPDAPSSDPEDGDGSPAPEDSTAPSDSEPATDPATQPTEPADGTTGDSGDTGDATTDGDTGDSTQQGTSPQGTSEQGTSGQQAPAPAATE